MHLVETCAAQKNLLCLIQVEYYQKLISLLMRHRWDAESSVSSSVGLLLQHGGVRLHQARATGVLRGVLGHQEQREVCQVRQEPDVRHHLGGLLHPGQQGR